VPAADGSGWRLQRASPAACSLLGLAGAPDGGQPWAQALAGLPDGLFQVLAGKGSVVGERFITNPDVRKIVFTGSTEVGKSVMRGAADQIKRVTLELGGKSPVIIDDSADIDKVAAHLAHAKQFNGGQACICPDYVFVKEDKKASLVEGFRMHVAQNLYSNGVIQKENIAQIVNDRNFNRVKSLFDDAVGQGATVAVGGQFEENSLTVHPTMLTDVTPQMTILQEEIFAPLLPVMTYETLDQVIAYIDARDKPLALYIYSNDEANIEKILSSTSSGGVTVNGVFSHYLESQLPFGGVNQSGLGSYHGIFGFKAFSHERAVYRHQS
jgi:aldehyde dehydrogenase (NAD+)